MNNKQSFMAGLIVLFISTSAYSWDNYKQDPPSKGGFPACSRALDRCKAALDHAQEFPATGQTTIYVSGDDGSIKAGASLSYTDNLDGTITDNNTKLQWEKKSADGSIHDQDILYTWQDAFAVHVAILNADHFGGYSDWRMPNVKELQSIINYQNHQPAVSTAFNNDCVAGTTVLTGSCTATAFYWSSTSFSTIPSSAWDVDFVDGFVSRSDKSNGSHVRAVRGGL